MRAVRFERFGEPAEVLHTEDMPTPEPGPGQVRVRMRARPINPSDLFMIRGRYGVRPPLPATPGFEGAGIVDALGADVTGLKVGQLVVPTNTNGTWQEYIVADARTLIAVPSALDERQAAMLLVNPTTAWLMLTETLQAGAGEWVIQNAANSAVGRFVIQIAKQRGVKTINVVRRHDVVAELAALGADAVLVDGEDDVVAQAKEITGGKGPQYALDSVAGRSGTLLAQSLASGGSMIVFGAISGEPLVLDAGALLFRGITITGWWLSQWFRQATPQQQKALFGAVLPMIADGRLHAPVAAEFSLDEVVAPCAVADGSELNGKVLLIG